MSKSTLDTTNRLPWVRSGPQGDGPIRAENLYHAVLFEAPDGRVTAECGRILVGATDTVIKAPGHWPDAFSCKQCIDKVRRARGR